MKKLYFFATLLLFAAFAGCGSVDSSDSGSVDTEPIVTGLSYSDNNPEGALRLFLEKLGKRDYAGAYEHQKNEEWGTYEKFSSTKAFGGIVKTTATVMDIPVDENGKKMIYAEVTYQDEVNGDKTFKQKFYLQSFGGAWKIVDMKVVKSHDTEKLEKTDSKVESIGEIVGTYEANTASTVKSLTVEAFDRGSYMFNLSAADGSGEAEVEGLFFRDGNNGVYRDTESACAYTFAFSKNSVKITDDGDGTCMGGTKTGAGTYKKVK